MIRIIGFPVSVKQSNEPTLADYARRARYDSSSGAPIAGRSPKGTPMDIAGHLAVSRAMRVVRTPRVRKLLIWAGSAIALFAIAGFLVAPPIVRHQLERDLSDRLHRDVAVERVRINPFAASVTVSGFLVKERDGSATTIGFDELYARLSYSSFVRLAPVVA